MWILYLLILIILMIPVGIYLYFYLMRMAGFFGLDIKKKFVRRIILIVTIIITIICINIWSTVALVILHIVVIALFMEFINKGKKKVRKKRGQSKDTDKTLWNKVYQSGLLPILITTIILCIGFYNMQRVIETKYTVQTEKNIQNQGYSVAMISDLHYGTIVHKVQLEQICNKIERQNPDIVVLCGDIVEESTTLEEMEEALKILGNIQSKYGVFYVYGNHDLSSYALKANYSKAQLDDTLVVNNIHLLVDESVEINNDFVIIGRDDAGLSLKANRKSGQELMENIDLNKFILLLDHQPIELKGNSQLGFDLQLSGHTHAGQIWPSGLLGQMFGLVELNYGSKKIGDFQAIVSSGIAGWGYPIRTESHCEYVIIDIK